MENVESTERLLRLTEAVGIVEQLTNDRPHVASLHRWASRGLRGVKLKTIYALGARRTTEKWLREFFASVSGEGAGEPSTASPEPDRLTAIEKAEQALDAGGISPMPPDPSDSKKRRRITRRIRRS
ncbi:DUF1580 domain-containing protein [Candidatus Laterigemmans baculatus]|uniref:DUF1580 domain-containing protein n=1 Tax=Candidatus Laterigemmans baculatus TaxID=2770505 RepID=UPI0013DB6649